MLDMVSRGLKLICKEIKGYEIEFIEIGTDRDYVHSLSKGKIRLISRC